MILFNIHRPTHFFSYFFIICILSSINSSRQLEIKNSFSSKLKSDDYKKFAKFCYIDNYSAWIDRQREFMMWFDLAKRLRLPVHEDKEFQHELKQYRLQYQCLRIVERFAISIGPG